MERFSINVVRTQWQVTEQHYNFGSEPLMDWIDATTSFTWEEAVRMALEALYIRNVKSVDTITEASIQLLAKQQDKSLKIDEFDPGQQCVMYSKYLCDNDDWKECIMVRVQRIL